MNRASRPYQWLNTVPDAEPAPVQDDADERHISYSGGRAFRAERSMRDPKTALTAADQRSLGQRAEDAAWERVADRDLRLAQAVQLGAALSVLRDGG